MVKRILEIMQGWNLTKGWKIALIITAAALAIGLTPVAVKAATGGEVDIYSEIWAAITALSGRVDAQDEVIAEQAAELEELRGLLTEAQGESEAEEGEEGPEGSTPPPASSSPPASTPGEGGGGDGAAGEPEPEPYINPYAHLNIDHLYIATADGVPRFSDYRVKGNLPTKSSGVNNPPGPPPFLIISGDGICFGKKDLDRAEKWLDGEGATYTVEAIYVDPLLYEIVAGKKFHDGPDVARRYINRVIAGKEKP